MLLRRVACLSVVSVALAGQAWAQDAATDPDDTFSIELNTAADGGGGNCLLTYLAVNGTGVSLGETDYDFVFLDTDRRVLRRIVVKFGTMVPDKRRIVQHELPGTGCADISEIIINTSTACTDAGGAETGVCMSALRTNSLTDIGFGI